MTMDEQAMTTVELTNTFHNTRSEIHIPTAWLMDGDPWSTLRLAAEGGMLLDRDDDDALKWRRKVSRVWRELCAQDGCRCRGMIVVNLTDEQRASQRWR